MEGAKTLIDRAIRCARDMPKALGVGAITVRCDEDLFMIYYAPLMCVPDKITGPHRLKLYIF